MCSLNAFVVFQQINLEIAYLVKAVKTCFPNYLLHVSEISKTIFCSSWLEMIDFNIFPGTVVYGSHDCVISVL